MTRQQRLTALLRPSLTGVGAVDESAAWLPTPQYWVWGPQGARTRVGLSAVAEDPGLAWLDWVARAYPGAVEAIVAAYSPPSELGQLETAVAPAPATAFDRIIGAVTTIVPAYFQYQTQKDVWDIQLERMRDGLPPLETGQYTPSMQIALDDQTVSRIGDEAVRRASSATEGVWPWIIGGGIGLGLLAFAMRGR